MTNLPHTPPSHHDILAWVGKCASAHWSQRKYPLSGTHASKLVHDQFGTLNYQAYGVDRFKDLLQPGNGKFFRMVIDGTRHSILPLETSSGPADAIRLESISSPKRFLKPEVWAAFTRRTPHIFDRAIKAFRSGTVCDVREQIQVEPVSEQAQKQWFLEFVSDRDPSNVAKAVEAVALPNWTWTVTGPGSFLSSSLRQTWKRFRFEKVLGEVEAWCKAKGVELDVFADERIRQHPQGVTGQVVSATTKGYTIQPDDDQRLRRALLNALERMPTHELIGLPIPPAYLLPFISRSST